MEWEELVRGGAVLPDYQAYEKLPGFPRWIWHCAYWDGPLSGPALYQGEVVWLECVAESEPRQRRYLVCRFAEGEWEAEQERQQRFEEYVGRHNTYDQHGRRRAGLTQLQASWERYYERYPAEWAKHRVAASGAVLGWVEEGEPEPEPERRE